MRPVNWLFSENIFEEMHLGDMKRIIEAEGGEVKVEKYNPLVDYVWREPRFESQKALEDIYPIDSCVVFYGTIQHAKKVSYSSWTPNVIAEWRNYLCSTYYHHYRDLLFNENAAWYPLWYIKRYWDQVLENFGRFVDDNTPIFIRPDNGTKEFIGAPYDKADFELSTCNTDENIWCLVAPSYRVDREWRYFASKGEVICGSMYKEDYRRKVEKVPHDKALELAKVVAANDYQPDIVFSIDICQNQDKFYLLEVGCFSCAGIYDADVELLVPAVNKAARDFYEECL